MFRPQVLPIILILCVMAFNNNYVLSNTLPPEIASDVKITLLNDKLMKFLIVEEVIIAPSYISQRFYDENEYSSEEITNKFHKTVTKSSLNMKEFLDRVNTNRSNTIIFSDFEDNLNDVQLLRYERVRDEKGEGIFLLNWSKGTVMNNQFKTISSVFETISNLFSEVLIKCENLDEMHLVGLGMGSHLAGYVGRSIKYKTNNKRAIKRISGLDPTFGGSYHILYLIKTPLNSFDAEFVDIIHTSYRYSADLATGTVNFWPNNFNYSSQKDFGEDDYNRYHSFEEEPQPGCKTDFLQCCHNRAIDFWLESLEENNKFPALSADVFYNKQSEDNYVQKLSFRDMNFMGYNAKPGQDINYYLRTGGGPTYSLGLTGIHSQSIRRF